MLPDRGAFGASNDFQITPHSQSDASFLVTDPGHRIVAYEEVVGDDSLA